jgi:DNA-binding LytR/AlgR family response regulator
MFKLKLNKHQYNDLQTKLEIENDENGSYVIVDDVSLMEKGKVNIYFEDNCLSDTKRLVSSLSNEKDSLLNFTTDKGNLRIYYNDVYYIQTYGNDVFLYSKNNQYLIKMTLYQLEEELKKFNFYRIGKATIVNINKIVEIQTAFNAKLLLILENKAKLEVMRSYVKGFKDYLKV